MDLVYLDPPFNSNRSYNVLFQDERGREAEAQITAFEDTWHWNAATEQVYQALVTDGAPPISGMIHALRQSIGANQMMAYLTMMAARLVELHRVLKPTGSLYLHCDPTASHYLKIIEVDHSEMFGQIFHPSPPKPPRRLGYPTQKPLALLERILAASSNPGDGVLDPFCGCGTTIAAAQKLGRRWIGIDITHLSIALMKYRLKYRLKDMFGLVEKQDYAVKGEPEDLSSARQLAQDDRYQFQWWALSLVKARPIGQASGDRSQGPEDKGQRLAGKKGADKGIDG